MKDFKQDLKDKLVLPHFHEDTREIVLLFKGRNNNSTLLEDIVTGLQDKLENKSVIELKVE